MTKTEKQLFTYKKKQMVENLMQTKEMQEKRAEYIMTALNGFFCITIDYLSRIKEWPKEELEEFMKFAKEQLHYVEDYDDYFLNMLKELKAETGIDVDIKWG